MIPTMKVVEIKPAQFIANSLPKGTDYNNTELLGRRAGFSDSDDWE